MQQQINVSAWGIRHNLGPISLPFRGADGQIELVQVTEGEPNLALSKVPEHLLSTFNVHGMEIPDWFLDQAPRDQQLGFRDALQRNNVTLANVTIDGRSLGDANPIYRNDDIAEIERMFALAAELGARAARVNLLPPPIVPSGAESSFNDIVAALRRLAQFAGERGMRLLIENHCALTDTPAKIQELLEAAGSGIGLILDTGNIEPLQSEIVASFMEKRPPRFVEDAEPAFRLIEQMLPLASVVHLKTYGYQPDGRPMVYDVDRAISIIARANFTGPITIECASFEPDKVYNAIERTVAKLKAALQ